MSRTRFRVFCLMFALGLLFWGRAVMLIWCTDVAPLVSSLRAAVALSKTHKPVEQSLQTYVVGVQEEVSIHDGPKVAELIAQYFPMVDKETQAVLVTYQEVGFQPELHLVMTDDDGRRAVSFVMYGLKHQHVSTRHPHPQSFTLAQQ